MRDHGPGFAEGDLPFVFDRFYRAERARKLPGSGLGLAIVRQAAEAHGGYARAQNAHGTGALLGVHFGAPLVQDIQTPADRISVCPSPVQPRRLQCRGFGRLRWRSRPEMGRPTARRTCGAWEALKAAPPTSSRGCSAVRPIPAMCWTRSSKTASRGWARVSTIAVARWMAGDGAEVAREVGRESWRIFGQLAAQRAAPLNEVTKRCLRWRDAADDVAARARRRAGARRPRCWRRRWRCCSAAST